MRIMAKLILTCSLAIFSLIAVGQDDTTVSKKAERKLNKEEKQKEAEADFKVLQEAAENKNFAVEFTRINRVQLTGQLNFVEVNEDRAIIQFETPNILAENGLGGRTCNGQISDYKFTPAENLKQSFYIQFNFTSKTVAQPVEITVSVSKSGYATVSIGTNSNIYGNYLLPDDTEIRKGRDMRD